MQTSQKSKLKVEHLQCQPSKMYGFVHWTWFRYSMQTIDCFRNTTVLRSPPNPFPIRKWFTNQCLAISYLAQQSWLPIVYGFFSILFYFLFLIVSWFHRQSQVDFSIFWYVRKFNLHNTRMFCWFFQTCCQFQAASAVTVILDLFSFGLANACVNHLCNICAQTDEHTMQNLPSHKFSHLLSVCQNVPYTKYELFDLWFCCSKNGSDDIKTSTKLLKHFPNISFN